LLGHRSRNPVSGNTWEYDYKFEVMYRNIAIAAAIVNNVLSQTNFQLVWNAHARGLLKFIKCSLAQMIEFHSKIGNNK